MTPTGSDATDLGSPATLPPKGAQTTSYAILGTDGTVGGPDGSPLTSSVLNAVAENYNVLDYGATGDGTTDDTSAIQAAINAAQSSEHGGVVFFPPGTYMTTSTLTVSSNAVSLIGAQSLGIWNGVIIAPSTLGFDVIEIDGVNDSCIIANMQIRALTNTGGSGGQSGSRGIFLNNVQGITILNVGVVGTYNGIYATGGGIYIADTSILPADIADSGRYGLLVTGASGNANSTGCHNVNVSTIGYTNTNVIDGVILADGYNSLTLEFCAALGVGINRGLWSTSNGGTAPNFLVTWGWCSDHASIGVQLDNGYYAVFDGLLITSCSDGAFNLASGYDGGPVQIGNFQIGPTNGTGVYIGAGVDTIVNLANGYISELGAGTTAGAGIEFDGGAQVTCTGVYVANPASEQSCLQFGSSFSGSATVTGCKMNNAQFGLGVESSSTTGSALITGCHFGAFSEYGYDIPAGSSFNTGGMTLVLKNNVWLLNPNTGGWLGIDPPAVTSGVAMANPYPSDCMVAITGGSVSDVQVDGVTAAVSSNIPVIVPVAGSLTITYDSAPTVTWLGF